MKREAHVMLIEDNEGDIVLTKEALILSGVQKVSVATDGQLALEMLSEFDILPDLILLDINLPKLDGLEVLTSIRSQEILRRIPVIMLTTSSSQKDIDRAYDHGANCYLTKPVDLDTFIRQVQDIRHFWLDLVTLPNREGAALG